MGHITIAFVIKASKEPSAVFRINEETFCAANVWILWNWSNFRTSITWSGLRRPNTNFPTIIKDQT